MQSAGFQRRFGRQNRRRIAGAEEVALTDDGAQAWSFSRRRGCM
jgi:hypothetical protein